MYWRQAALLQVRPISGALTAAQSSTIHYLILMQMDVCTFETAQKLKAAGFPQPDEPQYGSAWYDTMLPSSPLIFLSTESNTFYFVGRWRGDYSCPARFAAQRLLFAPRATDILRCLGLNYSLACDEVSAQIVGHVVETKAEQGSLTRTLRNISSENKRCAEACADVYLSACSIS